jgi:hypothetical protein
MAALFRAAFLLLQAGYERYVSFSSIARIIVVIPPNSSFAQNASLPIQILS